MKIAIVGGVRLKPLVRCLERHARDDDVFHGQGVSAAPATPIALGLHSRGHELLVIESKLGITSGRRFSGDRITVCVGPYRSRHRARDLFEVERDYISETLRREQPDIVHANWSYETALGALATGLPVLVTVRDWAPTILRHYHDPYRAARLIMNLWTLARARHFAAPSPHIATRLERWVHRTVRVIPNALPDSDFLLGPRLPPAYAHTLIAVNNGFSRLKNVGRLLEAFALVQRVVPDARLRLVGPEYEPEGLAQQWARERNLETGVCFEGSVGPELVAETLRGADILVHPSLEESFGTVVAQAMAQGVPVVAGRRSGAVPWLLKGGAAGVLSDVTSTTDLARSILTLVDDPILWRQFAQAGYEHAVQHFRVSVVLDRYLEAYASVLDASHSG